MATPEGFTDKGWSALPKPQQDEYLANLSMLGDDPQKKATFILNFGESSRKPKDPSGLQFSYGTNGPLTSALQNLVGATPTGMNDKNIKYGAARTSVPQQPQETPYAWIPDPKKNPFVLIK